MFTRTVFALAMSMVLCGSATAEGPCVALTFDDGPRAGETNRVLDTLAREGVKATFYVVGEEVLRYPELLRSTFKAGHEIGNHSWSHPWLSRMPTAQAKWQVDTTDALIEKLTGMKPRTLRAPNGALPADLHAVGGGRPFIGWEPDTNDWKHPEQSVIVRRALKEVDIAIVLMHDIHRWSVNALADVIRGLKKRSPRFVTVSELLDGACGFVAKPPLVYAPDYRRVAKVP